MSDPLTPCCPTCSQTMQIVRVGTLGVGWCSACAPEGFKEARDAKVSELLPVTELPDLTQFARWGPDDDIVN